MGKLLERVGEKHAETMWVTALTRGKKAEEEFLYHKVRHTKDVDPLAFSLLIEAGQITVHYLIRELPNGSAKDQGYLFKMSSEYIPALFAHTYNIDLGEFKNF